MKPSLHIASIVLADAWACAACGPSHSPQRASDSTGTPIQDTSRQPAREALEKTPGLELVVFPQSIRIQNDSLYFRYGLQNHTDTSFTVYNLGYIGYIWHWQSFSYLPNMGGNTFAVRSEAPDSFQCAGIEPSVQRPDPTSFL